MTNAFFKILLLAGYLFFTSQAAVKEINIEQQKGFFEGDLKLNTKQRNGVLAAALWPNGVIPYEHAAPWSQAQLDMIAEGMRAIEASTCIRFVKRTNEVDFLRFKNTTYGCWTTPGKTGGAQTLSLEDSTEDGTCFVHRLIVHELLHAIGMWHEQSRYDRDQYITVNWQNVGEDAKGQFKLVNYTESSVYGIAYNFYSVMHYTAYAFSHNGEMTMVPKDNYYTDIMGRVAYGHEQDWEKVRRMYQCKGKYTPAVTTAAPTTTVGYCRDDFDSCEKIKNTCNTEKSMRGWCRKTCGFCKSGELNCLDKITYCRQYAKECGNLAWLNDYCEKTCNLC